MKRIKRYFENAITCRPAERLIGMEIETLAIDQQSGRPISLATSGRIMKLLVEQLGWQIKEEKNGRIVSLEKGGFILTYDLGWNNFELMTPPYPKDSDELLVNSGRLLEELDVSAKQFGTELLKLGFDGCRSNTLMLPDKRDEIWLELDGRALCGLGHIAAVHINIDLVSVDEGMSMIRRLLDCYYQRATATPQLRIGISDSCWPSAFNAGVWRRYIKESRVGYESRTWFRPS